MANRTVQIIGYGFGATPATVTATVNGSQVFSGAVDTVNDPIPPMPIDPALVNSGTTLFTFEIPMNYSGALPMTVEVGTSPVVFAQIYANYANIANTSNTGNSNVTTFTSSGPTGFVNVFNPWPIEPPTEARSNTAINGMPYTITLEERDTFDPPIIGTWWWTINPGSTFSYDVNVTPGLE